MSFKKLKQEDLKMSDLKINNPIVKIDKPHQPYGQHVDHIQSISGIGAEKMRIDGQGRIISHEFIVKGGQKIDFSK